MSDVLSRLDRVSESEANAKLAALREVRDAFVFRRGGSPQEPTAAEFLVSEVCDMARRVRAGAGPATVHGGEH